MNITSTHNHHFAPLPLITMTIGFTCCRNHVTDQKRSVFTTADNSQVNVTPCTSIQGLRCFSPQLVPLVSSSGERERSNLQLLDMHGQDVHRWQRRPLLPRVFFPRQAQVVTLQKNLKQQFSQAENK